LQSNSNADNEYQDQVPAAAMATSSAVVQPDVSQICITQSDAVGMGLVSGIVMQGNSDPRGNVQYKIGNFNPLRNMQTLLKSDFFIIDQIPAHRQDIIVGQTPVVSAMSDAPSVEILPTPQKSKSKKYVFLL